MQASIANGDLKEVGTALNDAPYAALEDNLLVLLASPLLAPEGKKQIGTGKQYGVGADVLIMMGGLGAAVSGGNSDNAKSYLAKASDALDEVLLVCKSSGLKP